MIYIELFFRFFVVGLCSVGGGYAAMPIIQSQVVDGAGWMTEVQFADLVTISEMTPGPIIINAATFTGQQTAGFTGAFIATMGSIAPAILIVTAIAVFYFKHKNASAIQQVMSVTRPAVAAMVAGAAVSLLITALTTESWITRISGIPVDIWACVVTVICLVLLRYFKKSPITIIALSAVSGLVIYGVIPL